MKKKGLLLITGGQLVVTIVGRYKSQGCHALEQSLKLSPAARSHKILIFENRNQYIEIIIDKKIKGKTKNEKLGKEGGGGGGSLSLPWPIPYTNYNTLVHRK